MSEQILANGNTGGNKAIITVLGQDKVGIIAGISNILAETNVNILDISQTILQDIFTMVMVCEISKSSVEFGTLKDKLEAKGKELGVQIRIQHESVFHFMHRI